ncbi:hypothetical protein LTR17_021121 [Elasticomyces elasticus]|nr:hypothetical protein LTR17_021121 [Elasticomyces elasticus]
MTSDDSKAAFLSIPWARSILNRPNIVCRVPGSRKPKSSTEDTLFAEILKTPRTFTNCISYYTKPADDDPSINEVSTLIRMGDGMNGHPGILHGGIVASVLDEAMGILQNVNQERDHLRRVATLDIKYLKPVHTPDSLLVTARYTKRDGRKEWIHAEIKQHLSHGEDDYGEEIVCATGDALFIEPKPRTNKL